ncbi:hypothetical protein C8Q80DRAFT_1165537 [Daedaleopsis nitida]|nr:hypothetical protein C8Q80DRAFT_1165537 [Daedaleopsis nitida]
MYERSNGGVAEQTCMMIVMQAFFARRVFMLRTTSGYLHTWVPVFSVICMFSMLGFCIAGTYETYEQVTLLKWRRFTWILSGIFGSTVATDVMLTATLLIYLRSNRTGYKQTDSVLNILTVYTINTGLLTSTLSTLGLVFALQQPETLVYVAVSIPATKSYAIAVLSVLNSRSVLRDVLGTPRTDDFGAFGMRVLQDAATVSNRSRTHAQAGPIAWDGNPETVINISQHSQGSRVVPLRDATVGDSSSSRDEVFELKSMDVV